MLDKPERQKCHGQSGLMIETKRQVGNHQSQEHAGGHQHAVDDDARPLRPAHNNGSDKPQLIDTSSRRAPLSAPRPIENSRFSYEIFMS
ncbi:hypothetical protein [Martelella soudanensis]|uniref:hypothetical protein n=1 Tax=unclassified Martelella TaxID=2629616 RepID=UPI0015DFD412|nr:MULTISPECIES: hypothetical protein [unclassified Martelella]